jgi:hypothetical protein
MNTEERTKLLGNQPSYDSIESPNSASDGLLSEIDLTEPSGTSYFFLAFFLVIFFLFGSYYFTSTFAINRSDLFIDGMKIQFSTVEGNFFRVDKGRTMDLISDKSFPYLHGSTFEVFRDNNECVQLKSMDNRWLAVDRSTGKLHANGITKLDGNYFSIIPSTDIPSHVNLKLCYLEEYFRYYRTNRHQETLSMGLQAKKTGQFPFIYFFRQLFASEKSVLPKFRNDFDSLVFQVHIIEPLKGVNLGGWFIPEYWMNPTFFQKSPFGWGSALCR